MVSSVLLAEESLGAPAQAVVAKGKGFRRKGYSKTMGFWGSKPLYTCTYVHKCTCICIGLVWFGLGDRECCGDGVCGCGCLVNDVVLVLGRFGCQVLSLFVWIGDVW